MLPILPYINMTVSTDSHSPDVATFDAAVAKPLQPLVIIIIITSNVLSVR